MLIIKNRLSLNQGLSLELYYRHTNKFITVNLNILTSSIILLSTVPTTSPIRKYALLLPLYDQFWLRNHLPANMRASNLEFILIVRTCESRSRVCRIMPRRMALHRDG